MGVTFSTSAECYRKISGTDKTPTTNTRPSLLFLDDRREDAKAAIYRLIDTTTDISGVAKRIEMNLVYRMAMNAIYGPRYSEDLSQSEVDELVNVFSKHAVGSLEPNQDGSVTD